jgi:tRNA G18 (ribose-2'-O)-methylase SpoU
MEPRGIFAKKIASERNGIVNQRTQWKELNIDQVKNISTNVLPFNVLLLSLNGDLNIGMSIRSAHLTGASSVIVYGRRKVDTRTTVGSHHYSSIERIDGLTKDLEIDYIGLLKLFKERNLIPVFVEQHPQSIRLEDTKWKFSGLDHNYCFIFGNESTGIPQEFINDCLVTFPSSFVIELTQLNIIRSFNVSTTVSIVCYQFMTSYLKYFKDS